MLDPVVQRRKPRAKRRVVVQAQTLYRRDRLKLCEVVVGVHFGDAKGGFGGSGGGGGGGSEGGGERGVNFAGGVGGDLVEAGGGVGVEGGGDGGVGVECVHEAGGRGIVGGVQALGDGKGLGSRGGGDGGVNHRGGLGRGVERGNHDVSMPHQRFVRHIELASGFEPPPRPPVKEKAVGRRLDFDAFRSFEVRLDLVVEGRLPRLLFRFAPIDLFFELCDIDCIRLQEAVVFRKQETRVLPELDDPF